MAVKELNLNSDSEVSSGDDSRSVFPRYVAAKATYIRLLHGKIGFLGSFSALAP